MSGTDLLINLPTDPSYTAKPGEIELTKKLFGGPQQQVTTQQSGGCTHSFSSMLKLSVFAGLLFFVLNLPFIPKMVTIYTKNSVMTYVVLTLLFIVIFFVIQKVAKI